MGDQATRLLGVWLLRSAYGERVDTKERTFLFGENPRGVLILHEGGRMAAIITPSLQPDDPPPSPRQLVAYSGRYRIEPGGRFERACGELVNRGFDPLYVELWSEGGEKIR